MAHHNEQGKTLVDIRNQTIEWIDSGRPYCMISWDEKMTTFNTASTMQDRNELASEIASVALSMAKVANYPTTRIRDLCERVLKAIHR